MVLCYNNAMSKNELQSKSKSDLLNIISQLKEENTTLQEELQLLKAKLFGTSSEKMASLTKQALIDKVFNEAEENASPDLGNEEPYNEGGTDENNPDSRTIDTLEENKGSNNNKRQPKRRKLPENLPRKIIEIDLPDSEKECACGCTKKLIGVDASEKLEVIPATCVVLRYERKKYACSTCQDSVSIPQLPKFLLPKSIASSGLVAQTAINKYARHLPLHRQEEIWNSLGVELSRSSTCNWLMNAYEACKPLIDVMKTSILKQDYLQADETPVQVLNELNRKDTQKSYMWVYQAMAKDKKLVLFDYQETRGANHPKSILENFSGYLQTDAYKGYDWVSEKDNIRQLGCMAHARRPFAELAKAAKKSGKSHQALSFIKGLYNIERKAKEENLSVNERKALRLKEAAPILEKLKKWAEKSFPNAAPGSKLYKAFDYLLTHWDKLIRYLEDGHLEIDNNDTEREIRPFALGKKNWMFAASPRGAHASAFFYSLIGSAKLNHLEPYDYLKHVFDNIQKCKTTKQLEALLPFNCDLTKKPRGP